ncbi:MAG: hexosaminidase [Saprospiraceae bacterium]
MHFNVITNVLDGKDQFQAELLITNESTFTLKDNWSIYFNFLRSIIPLSVSDGFQIRHINGDYFCIEPTADFTPLLSKSKVTIGFIGSFWAIKKIDAPVGFYIVYKDEAGNELSPESIPSLSIGDFTHPKQVTRSANDLVQIPTSESRYEKSREVFLLPKESLTPIMPSPAFYEGKQGIFPIKSTAIIAYQVELYSEALHLSKFLGRYLGRPLSLLEGTQGDIRLSTGKVVVAGYLERPTSESYTI